MLANPKGLPLHTTHYMKKEITIASVILTSAAALQAGTDTWFTPLTESAPVVAPNAPEELTQPWVAPEGVLQKRLVSLRQVEDQVLSFGQSLVRIDQNGQENFRPTLGSMFDMIAYDDTGNFLFIPHETPWGAGVSRLSLFNCHSEVLFRGDSQGPVTGDWSNDYGAFDPCRFTPNGTVFAAEEWAGQGRVIEILNPFADPADIEIRELDSIANVAHEGINFSTKYDDTIYFVDENNSGSVYKFVMRTPGIYTVGQTFVLSVDEFAATGGDATQNWNAEVNAPASRVGMATWVPLTDEFGTPLPGITNPFRNGFPSSDNPDLLLGGRPAADDAGATPYGRPEDMEVVRLANGHEAIYFAATSEATVYSVEIMENRIPGAWARVGLRWVWVPGHVERDKAMVRVFASAETPKNDGFDATSGVLNSPDNLAQDALGNIYIIEDSPNSSDTGGDIWFARDIDNDGQAESIDHFLSLRVDGSEATGMIFNPAFPEEFVVAVQHPDSTDLSNVPDGLGDSVWMFNLSIIPNQEFLHELRETAR